MPVAKESWALRLAAIDMGPRFGIPAIRAAFTPAAADSAAEAFAEALAAALALAEARAAAENAAATLALTFPRAAASCEAARRLSRSVFSRLLHWARAVDWASSTPRAPIGKPGGWIFAASAMAALSLAAPPGAPRLIPKA